MPSFRFCLLTAWALPSALMLCVAGCDDSSGERAPPAPQVTLAVPETPLADVRLSVRIQVSGCDTVRELTLYDRDRPLKSIPDAQSPTLVTLEPNEVPYARGLPADLSLWARVRCDDERTGDSSPVPLRFLPVAKSVEAPQLPERFFAEGFGDNTTFVGCRPDEQGLTALVRADSAGHILHTQPNLPFGCSESSWFTDRNDASGVRWLVQNGVGAVAFDAAFEISAVILDKVQYFLVGPDGDGLYWNASSGRLTRVDHRTGAQVWSVFATGILTGTPVVNPSFGIVIPQLYAEWAGEEGIIYVDLLRYSDGLLVAANELKRVRYGFGDAPTSPPVGLSADGTVAYIPFQLQAGSSGVVACATTAAACSGANQKWQTVGLAGDVELTLPYAQGTLVAALGQRQAWFLDATTGAVVNRSQSPLTPEGALVTQAVQPGAGRDFYLLNGAARAGATPLELVALDSPEAGELFRYSVPSGNLTLALDDAGGLWLRLGERLVQPLPLSEYRKVLP